MIMLHTFSIVASIYLLFMPISAVLMLIAAGMGILNGLLIIWNFNNIKRLKNEAHSN